MKNQIFLFLLAGFSFVWANNDFFWLITIPKSGTHPMMRTCKFITGRKILGIGHPTIAQVKDALTVKGKFLFSHGFYDDELANVVRSMDARVIFLIRHPLDQLASLARFMHRPSHISWGKIKHLRLSEVISGLLLSSKWLPSPYGNSLNFRDFYELFTPWMDEPFVHVVKYEDFIGGPENSLELRKVTIKGICDFLEIDISEEKLTRAAKDIDKTHLDGTYRPGNKIGRWKEYLTEHDLELFRSIGGDTLMNHLDYSY